MDNSQNINRAIQDSITLAAKMHHEYITPEHFLYCLLDQEIMEFTMINFQVDSKEMRGKLMNWLKEQEQFAKEDSVPVPSIQFTDVMKIALRKAVMERKEIIDIKEYAEAILSLQDSFAAYVLGSAIENVEKDFLNFILRECEAEKNELIDDYDENGEKSTNAEDWHKYVTNVSEQAKSHTPLIGREKELDRTIQVLCRMEKNNPMHVGDPGVGKTAIIYGLATMINSGNVPEKLKGRKVYSMDVSELLAGAQFRGDFEKKIKTVLKGATKEHAILYLDEIHNIIGAGKGSDGGPDASNMMKPYLQSGEISFIGATTHEEYARRICKDKAIVRRFQTIDINEPTIDETIAILKGLQPSLQKFHNVIYHKDAIEYAVKASAKHITERKLPDKAIDLMDEAGAYLEVHPQYMRQRPYVTKAIIEGILIKTCKIQAEALKETDNGTLVTLKENILNKIYGQNKAVKEVTDAVMMAKAGLADDDKPLASLLFVGPTGVGKTEVAKVLAKELGVELVRFDMSEYNEKHTIAKLIGSPAGYVGYEDGGLLTAAIRRTPNCVLLFDEIEKAHSDIYNILLQVMDYAKLTDNKGEKADFRNVILIMTSNAGAQYASQASIGFGGGSSRGEAMMAQVKKTFKPEFINRLNDIVVFNDMDKKMAAMILKKKLNELKEKLSTKSVRPIITDKAFEEILKKGFTKEYGARELDRIIAQNIKPLFVKEILFGKLKKGGETTLDYNDEHFYLENKNEGKRNKA